MLFERIEMQGAGDVSLCAYILDSSGEMPNMAKRPAILVCPGGGYHFCSDREAEPVAMEFMTQGYNAFVLRYSVKEASEWPNPLTDAENAMEIIKKRADEWNIDSDKIAVIGFSAGGHLACALSVMGRIRPNAAILGYPCILDSINPILANDPPSLDSYVSEETPPTFIFASSDDGCVPIEHSLQYSSALAKEKIPFEMHIFNGGGHGFSVANHTVCSTKESQANTKLASRWVKMCMDWLNKTFDI